MNKIEKNTEELQTYEKVFAFFTENYLSKNSFTKEEFEKQINDPNFETYWSKKIRTLLEEDFNNKGHFFIAPVFKRYNQIEKFERHFSQSTKVSGNYKELIYSELIIYEFFMPLNNETALKSALDDLFYKDTIKLKFQRIEKNTLNEIFPKNKDESEESYIKRYFDWISETFGGYSIQQISGRFRVDDLSSFEEVSKILASGREYLINESTAIVRFIFKLGKPTINEEVNYDWEQFKKPQQRLDSYIYTNKFNEELKKIRFFFKNLFVQTILNIIDGEDEIWMIERTNQNSQLYIWKNQMLD